MGGHYHDNQICTYQSLHPLDSQYDHGFCEKPLGKINHRLQKITRFKLLLCDREQRWNPQREIQLCDPDFSIYTDKIKREPNLFKGIIFYIKTRSVLIITVNSLLFEISETIAETLRITSLKVIIVMEDLC